MKYALILSFLLLQIVTFGGGVNAQDGEVSPILTQALTDLPGKEVLMLTVSYPPGGTTPVHRHNAHVFVYVTEGSVEMQVKDGPPVTLTVGQTFYESPSEIHLVSRNASNSQPAKFVVFMVKSAGAPPVIPVK